MSAGLLNLDRVLFFLKQHEYMDPSYPVSMEQAGGSAVMVWEFSWHMLGPLIPTEHHCHNIPADHVHHVMATVYPLSSGYNQQVHASQAGSTT
uniref:Uncharacterized protein n=1 Tax=Anguilla anguilla TaxID=7936 RepID=A0A0E9XRM1_ANGAN